MERFISDTYKSVVEKDYAGFVDRIRAEMDETGMSVVEDFLHPDFLAELRTSVDELTPICYQNGKR